MRITRADLHILLSGYGCKQPYIAPTVWIQLEAKICDKAQYTMVYVDTHIVIKTIKLHRYVIDMMGILAQ